MSIELQKIPWAADPYAMYCALTVPGQPSALLESLPAGRQARPWPATCRFSVVAKDPFLTLRHEKGVSVLTRSGKAQRIEGDPFPVLKELLAEFVEPADGFPPFAGGAIGYLGYECKDWLEPTVASRRSKARELPDLCFLFFDRCLVWDHASHELYLCGRGKKAAKAWEEEVKKAGKARVVPPRGKKPQPPAMDIERSFDEKTFGEAVKKAKAHIKKGDIFQANIAQRFSFPMPEHPRAVYGRLRQINPSPFFGVFDAGDFQIVSGSPERLLKLEGRNLETRPIAGTRGRGKNRADDRRLGLDLLLSEKERAEHIMLVDLERNDLGRVAEYGSVSVDELMAIEDYSHVKHIVSNVRATLREGLTGLDALKAFFPGGTITGAPKVRCMQIIDELEPVARGPYTGSLGYLSFTGAMDFNILIRSLAIRGRRASLHVGAGIVADSDPKKEHHETLHKAEAVLEAVFGQARTRAYLRSCRASA